MQQNIFIQHNIQYTNYISLFPFSAEDGYILGIGEGEINISHTHHSETDETHQVSNISTALISPTCLKHTLQRNKM